MIKNDLSMRWNITQMECYIVGKYYILNDMRNAYSVNFFKP